MTALRCCLCDTDHGLYLHRGAIYCWHCLPDGDMDQNERLTWATRKAALLVEESRTARLRRGREA